MNLLSSLCSRNMEIISLNASSDTMDLLGGFEQADMGRSILELFDQIQLKIKSIVDCLLEKDVQLGLRMMESLVRLNGLFNSGTQTKKRKRQLEVLSDLIDIVGIHNGVAHQELLAQLNLLKSASKHGTFEWIESVLCRALRDGSWLLIDNVNLCSASVLDRLNALFEHGGKLTVSERGVLDGQIPEVTPHPDFRVFMLYDPSRGDISRAMRNRGVEIYVPASQEVQLSSSDKIGLVSTYLSSALPSDATVGQSLGIDHLKGLKDFTEKVSILGLQSLSGCPPDEDAGEQGSLEQRLCWLLSSSNICSLFPNLAEVCFRLLPVIEFSKDEELLRISFNYFLNFLRNADTELTLEVASLILETPSLTETCKKFKENALFVKYSESSDPSIPWESRILPFGRDSKDDLPNRLSLILVTYSKFKALQDRVNENPKCLLSSSSSSFKLSSPVLEQFSNMIMSLLKALETELNQESELTNFHWIEFDSLLFWVYELGVLGLQTLDSNQEEDLERLLYVFWFWMAEKLKPLADVLTPELKSVFNKYHSLIESLNYDSNSFSKFRAITDLCPSPPATLESLDVLEQFYKIDTCIKSRDVKSRINLLANTSSKVDTIISDFKSEALTIGEASASLVQELENFASPEKLSSSLFYQLQLTTLMSRLSQLSGTPESNVFLPVKLRMLMEQGSENMEISARLNLFYCINPDRKIFTLEHNPIELTLADDESKVEPSNITSMVTSVLVSDAGVPLVCFQEKQEQVTKMVNILKDFKSPDVLSRLQQQYSDEMKTIISALLISHDLDGSFCSISNVLDIVDLDKNVRLVLTKIASRPLGTSFFETHLNHVLLNLLKLHIYGCLGAIDPAEKEALKYNQTLKELKYVNNQVEVIDRFKESVGTNHPHRSILTDRATNLEDLSSSMVCRTAERGNQSFSRLSNTVKHYKDSLASVSTLVQLVDDLRRVHQDGELGNTLSETRVWVKSSTKFASDLLEHYSFPDLIIPIVESVSKCIVAVEAAVEQIHQKSVRDRCDNLERIVMVLSDPVVPPADDLHSLFRFCLDPRVPGLLDNNHDLKILKSMMVFMKQSLMTTPNISVPSNLLHETIFRILQAWRSELELKEKQKLEEEALFKSRNVCTDEDEEKDEEDEFKTLFPSFREVFADITPSDNLNDDMAVEEEAKPTFSVVRMDIIKDVSTFILKFIGTENVEGFSEISKHDFQTRIKAVNALIANQAGVNSLKLEVNLVPSLISLSNTLLYPSDKKKDYNFYADPNEEESKLMKPILLALGSFVNNLLEEFPENPLLVQVLVVRDKILSFSLNSPIAKNLTGLELLLETCQEWEKNAHRGVSLQSMMSGVSTLILRWRKLELTNWKPILAQSLETLRRESCEFWLHVMGVVLESKNKTDTVRALIQFVEGSSLADFNTRMEILKSVQRVMVMLDSKKKWLIAALENIHQYFSRFCESIDARLDFLFKDSDKKVGEFVKMARWKDTNFWSVKIMVDKTRKVLHKALREYKKIVSVSCKQYFVDEGSSEVADPTKVTTIEKVLVKSFKPTAPMVISSIKNFKLEDIGSFEKLSNQAFQISLKINKQLLSMNLVEEISELTPNVVSEMDKLQKLTVNPAKPKEEQKKQAGFIQQRKRKALNDLFKTLQGLGLSYRHGLMNCGDLNTNQELFHKLDNHLPLWADTEKYFFR